MSQEPVVQFEQRRIRELAEEYERRGYVVQTTPTNYSVPGLPEDYVPDIVAVRGSERLLVEVRSQAALASTPPIASIAEAIRAQPGWTFELVVVDPPGPADDDVAGAESTPIPLDERLRMLDVARSLLAGGDSSSALVLAWSAVEATLRDSTWAEGAPDAMKLGPVALTKLAFSYGLLTRPQLEALLDAAEARNVVVHGFTGPANTAEMSRRTIDVADELLRAPVTS